MKKRYLLSIATAILLSFLYSGCDLQNNDAGSEYEFSNQLQSDLDLNLALRGEELVEDTIGRAVSSTSPSTVPVEANITVGFDTDINPSTLNTTTFKVIRIDTNETLGGSVTYANRVATFTPARIFVSDTVNKKTIRKGLKQDTSYKIVLQAANVKSTSGAAQGSADFIFNFKTVNLDFGMFFLGPNGEYQKAVTGISNPYFDKTKPTAIYFHGWQNNSTSDDFVQDNAFYFNSSTIGSYNAIPAWRNLNYNVCIVYWSQWADEGEVKDAQAKLWLGANGRKNMRYRIRGGSYVEYSTTKSVTDLIFDQYKETFNGNTGSIRFLGHSLGNQFATLLAFKISNAVAAGTMSSNLMPKRIALLDPFWGKSSESYSGNVYPGAKCVEHVTAMLKRDAFALEVIRTNSNIGYWVGDGNVNMRKLAAYYNPWPSFGDDTAKHCYAYNWYVLSIGKVAYADKVPGSGGLGSLAGDDQIKSVMNWNFTTKAIKTTLFKYDINLGKTTVTPADDTFKQVSGVN
jgi:hypothetical protein